MIFKEAELDIDPEAGGASSNLLFSSDVLLVVVDVVHRREYE
jgi:hypothetical protein